MAPGSGGLSNGRRPFNYLLHRSRPIYKTANLGSTGTGFNLRLLLP